MGLIINQAQKMRFPDLIVQLGIMKEHETIRLPATARKEPPIGLAGALAGRRALILSNNLMEAEAIARTIVAHGGLAEIARTVEEAAAAARANRRSYDVVLVDAALEHVDGRMLRQLRKAGIDAPEAVTLISPTDRGHLADYRASGYDTFLARPVRGQTLVRVLLSSPARPAPRAQEKPAARAARAGGLRVLIAEDNDINALLARSVLSKAGHTVEVVRNGKAAVEALTAGGGAHQFDVVLMDLHMPVMDGLDAISLIRQHEDARGVPPVPILVLSADSQETTRHGVIAHGASGFLTKPVDPQAMTDAVEVHAHG